MAFCKNCGNKLPEGSTFCSKCGTPVYDKSSQTDTEQHQYGTQQNGFFNSDDVTAEFDPMDIKENKLMAVLSYMWILVLIPIFVEKKSKYVKFHATQGLNVAIVSVGMAILVAVLKTIIRIVFFGSLEFGIGGVLLTIVNLINMLVSIGVSVLEVLGIINVVQGKCKKLPVLGKLDILGKFMK